MSFHAPLTSIGTTPKTGLPDVRLRVPPLPTSGYFQQTLHSSPRERQSSASPRFEGSTRVLVTSTRPAPVMPIEQNEPTLIWHGHRKVSRSTSEGAMRPTSSDGTSMRSQQSTARLGRECPPVLWESRQKVNSSVGLPSSSPMTPVMPTSLDWTSEDQETPTLFLERSGLGSLPSPFKAAPPNASELLPQISSLLYEHQKAIMCQLERQERALQQIKGRLDQQQSQAVSTYTDQNSRHQIQSQRQKAQQQQNVPRQQNIQQFDEQLENRKAEEKKGAAPFVAQPWQGAHQNGDSPEMPLLQKDPDHDDSNVLDSTMLSWSIPNQLLSLGKQTAATRMTALFPKLEDIKISVLDSLRSHNYDVEEHYHTDGICQKIVRHDQFKNFMLFAVVTNTFWIGIETDYDRDVVPSHEMGMFQIVDNVYCAVFVFEIFVRFRSFREKSRAFADVWFVFDSILMIMIMWESWLLQLFNSLLGYAVGASFAQRSQILRILRLVRLVKVARAARLLHSIPELAVIGHGMVQGVRSLLAVWAMMVVIIYAFGVLFTMLLSGTDVGVQKFNSVAQSMNSLLICVLCGPETRFMEDLIATRWEYYTLFLIFLLIAVLILLNMLTAMLCDVVSKASDASREGILVKKMETRLSLLAASLDNDGDGRLDKDEFEIILKDPLMIASLIELDVDIVEVINFAKFIYDQCDSISYSDFALLVSRYRSGKSVTGQDIMDLKHYISMEILELGSRLLSTDKDTA